MDFEMPIMNGIQATRELRKTFPITRSTDRANDLIIIGITAYIGEEENCLKAGMDKLCKILMTNS
jgi:CheY-like chemotaxis protein